MSEDPTKEASDFETPPELQRHSFITEALETVRFILVALAIVLPIRMFIAQPFVVSGASMDPTFATGQYLIIDEVSYHIDDPMRGDVIIFKYPKNPSQYFIKRVIGLPGEIVNVDEQGKVSIKNAGGKVIYTLAEPYVEFTKSDHVERTLGLDEYFVMGDNRAGSFDSRIWGPVKRDLIVGKAFLRLFPVSTASILPGQFRQ